jgi:hypothetical protein
MKAFTKISVVLALVGTVTVIHADSAAPQPVPAPAGNGNVSTREISNTEMLATSARLDAQMKADLDQVMELKEIAKKQKDVIKLNCVNDRLIQVKAELNIADSTNQQLQVSLSRNSDDRKSLFQQYEQTASAVKSLRGDADSCIGAPDLMKQESGTTVDRPLIPDDPAYTPPLGEEFEPPAYASPYN